MGIETQSQEEKVCPFCAETIKAAAIVCKHCGRDLPKAPGPDESLMLRHGIVYKDERYIWRGNYFKQLDEAVEFVKRSAPDSIIGTVTPGPIEERASEGFPIFKTLGIVALTLVAIVLVFGNSVANDPKTLDRRAIEACWGEHDRKSLDPETKRFVAGACEAKEREFAIKYGHKP